MGQERDQSKKTQGTAPPHPVVSRRFMAGDHYGSSMLFSRLAVNAGFSQKSPLANHAVGLGQVFRKSEKALR
jgi:hypothetical protein